MFVHRQSCTFVACITLLATAGCGAVKSAVGAAPPIHNDTFEAVVGHSEFADRSGEPECMALRGKIDISRNLFEGSSEMDAVTATAEWKVLDNAYTAFKEANCPAITANHEDVSDNCAHLGDNVADAWNDLQETPAWQAAVDNSNLQDLVGKWKEAKSIDCVNH